MGRKQKKTLVEIPKLAEEPIESPVQDLLNSIGFDAVEESASSESVSDESILEVVASEPKEIKMEDVVGAKGKNFLGFHPLSGASLFK